MMKNEIFYLLAKEARPTLMDFDLIFLAKKFNLRGKFSCLR